MTASETRWQYQTNPSTMSKIKSCFGSNPLSAAMPLLLVIPQSPADTEITRPIRTASPTSSFSPSESYSTLSIPLEADLVFRWVAAHLVIINCLDFPSCRKLSQLQKVLTQLGVLPCPQSAVELAAVIPAVESALLYDDRVSVSIHRRKAKIKDLSPHHRDCEPWDEEKKHFAYLGVGIGMIVHFQPTYIVLGADPGKEDIRFTDSQVQDTCTTPKVNFRYNSAEYYQHANIKLARKWREWRLNENLKQVDAGICWFMQYIEAMLAHYTTLNNHAEWPGQSTGRNSEKWSECGSSPH
ncbi:hypothetical protein BJ742DRAFT_869784 [Cladochytrium replicatum]|nr:hypothetical protein BJ742DRAFT_869784 [Cladochytrium replicatum]